LITAAFLHANLAHLLSNVVTAYIFISRLEASFHSGYIIAIFFISAICGNILSDLASSTSNQIAVGASTALFGFIASFVAYLIINWQTLAGLGPLRGQLTCIIGLLVFMSLLFSFVKTNNSIDYYGHLGGFIGGLFGSLMLLPPIDINSPKTTKIVGSVILSVYLLVTFLVFYLAKYN
jgi:rhomboid protease GluP